MTAPRPCPGILDIAPYIPGRAEAESDGPIYKLSSNESPLGASPMAKEAFRQAGDNLEYYPDGSAWELRNALAGLHGLNPDRIICGNGSDELLELLAHAYLAPGDEAIYSQYGFLVYPIAIKSNGAAPVIAPEKNLTADVDAILERAGERTKIVFLANPNNPTGTYLPFDEVKRLHAGLPETCLLVLDAAYAEYVRRNDYEAGIELVSGAENVVMTRTFSKAYGLAGLRLGWLYGPENIVDVLNRVRGPFNVNAAAIAAGVAAVKDTDFLRRAIEHNDKWLPWLSGEMQKLGLQVTPSIGNFLLVHFPDENGKRAPDADRFLGQRGLILRAMGAYGFPNALRVSVGTEEANRLLIEALADFLEKR